MMIRYEALGEMKISLTGGEACEASGRWFPPPSSGVI